MRGGRRALFVLGILGEAWMATLAPCYKMVYWLYTIGLFMFPFNPRLPKHLKYFTHVCFNSDIETIDMPCNSPKIYNSVVFSTFKIVQSSP